MNNNRVGQRAGRPHRNGQKSQEQLDVEELCRKVDKQIADRRRQLPLIRSNRDVADSIGQLEIELRSINRDRTTLADLKTATDRLLNNKGASFLTVKRQCEQLLEQKRNAARGVARVVVNNALFAPAAQARAPANAPPALEPLVRDLDPEIRALMDMDVNE